MYRIIVLGSEVDLYTAIYVHGDIVYLNTYMYNECTEGADASG